MIVEGDSLLCGDLFMQVKPVVVSPVFVFRGRYKITITDLRLPVRPLMPLPRMVCYGNLLTAAQRNRWYLTLELSKYVNYEYT
jgi:hypothetical protein